MGKQSKNIKFKTIYLQDLRNALAYEEKAKARDSELMVRLSPPLLREGRPCCWTCTLYIVICASSTLAQRAALRESRLVRSKLPCSHARSRCPSPPGCVHL